jgi:enterobactin synthetase component D
LPGLLETAELMRLDFSRAWLPMPHQLAPPLVGVAMRIDAENPTWFEALAPSLPSSIRGAVPARQAAFMVGRLCAERAMSQAGGAVVVPRGEKGEPVWPAGFVGSISHTARAAYAVVAPSSACLGVGIDAEPMVDDEGKRSLQSVCCTAWECAQWYDGSACDAWTATAIFSLKEAFYKAIYPQVRRFVDFDEVEVISLPAPHVRGRARLRPVATSSLAQAVSDVCAELVTLDACVHSLVVLRAE